MEFSTDSPIVFGAGAFNNQYNKDPGLNNVVEVVKYAIDNGINTFDTAAGYGPSEEILGNALSQIGYSRDKYRICTKCCRWENSEFSFSRESVLKSFERSLARLQTDHIDVLYIHDVEFGDPKDVLEAISTAFELRDAGRVKAIGISGYPLNVLITTVKMVKKTLGRQLDVVLSYCNLTLQNDLLLKAQPQFLDAGVKLVMNASPLSMSMLRSRPTHDFHRGQSGLHKRANKIGLDLLARGIELADIASQYAFAKWAGPTIIGLRTTSEIDAAILNRKIGLEQPNTELWSEIQNNFGEWHNTTWDEEKALIYKDTWNSLSRKL